MPVRRNFTAHYKLKILEEADHCEEGKITSLLRREGLYSSHLTKWRRQRKEGSLSGLNPRKRGKPAKVLDASSRRIVELEKANSRLSHRLQQAELIIDVQKKVSEMFGICLQSVEEKRKTS
ncbi:MAG: helix-turn-helix domain-containing protein [Verrucomicrobia bacterium]|nr:helix-turn-helix domain-containing protein [Verrucomicrobiota bacterium]